LVGGGGQAGGTRGSSPKIWRTEPKGAREKGLTRWLKYKDLNRKRMVKEKQAVSIDNRDKRHSRDYGRGGTRLTRSPLKV